MSRAWVILKRIGRILRFILICICISLCIFFLWRASSTGTPKELKGLLPNDKLNAEYAQKGEGVYVFEQKYDQITRADRNAGYFSVPEARFIPDINQAQIVFRYNNSTITSMAKDYNLPGVPDRNAELFDVSLVLYIDLTPDNPDDNYDINSSTIKKVRCTAQKQLSAKTKLYNFYRYVFDFENASESVNIAELIANNTLIAVHTDIYYKGDLDYTKEAYGAICIYDCRYQNRPVELSKADKKALAG